MSDAIAEATLNARPEKLSADRATALILATDGTKQSDAAVSIVRLLAPRSERHVSVLTVVDHAPIPWGTADRSLVLDYDRGLQAEARKKVTAQLERLGDDTWQVEVRTGNPATVIADMAKESRARLIVVGLGGHGVGARLFGNETALRLMRLSETPVLAINAGTRALPRRMLVAMDFSESSIEAARLALEIAAPASTMTLVHVVPWERNMYVPETWFQEHEAYIAAHLKRVSGWLDDDQTSRIHQKIIYGKPGPALLACAEELEADLIVAGTHGRNFVGRMLGGETVSKLVRGARCSVLVLPHAASSRRLPQAEETQSVREGRRDF